MEKEMAKEGRKVRYTRMVLQNSLIELMREKPIMRISVKEICTLADIGRTTFYAHYNDQYDLLQQIENQTFIEADKIMQPHLGTAKRSGGREIAVILRDLLQFIADNSNSIQVLLSENGDSGFQKKFFRTSIEGMRQFMESTGVIPEDKRTKKYGFVFFAGGMLTLVQDWLKNGMDTPVSEMVKMLVRITRDALR
jgi:AcrR family transcriptional regulator